MYIYMGEGVQMVQAVSSGELVLHVVWGFDLYGRRLFSGDDVSPPTGLTILCLGQTLSGQCFGPKPGSGSAPLSCVAFTVWFGAV